ncbi:hypothetical protein EVJ58_g7078 [Rhodofomes roseus]|uniref:Cytochrome P450 n=1 Tax=Rhodofomes roseus TaxID=34475 RepID=A0A4Y9Y5G2_9APHY|nr:hypothetical protein EVJ58_g7078 [Rhodofomes roseus]
MDPTSIRIGLSGVILAILLYAAWHRYKRNRARTCEHIRGPPSPSYLLGHIVQLTRQDEVGDLEYQWMNEYGWAWKIRHCLGRDVLFLADPKALHHVFRSGYAYARTTDSKFISWLLMGESILFTDPGFDFNCGALDEDLNEFVGVYKNMFRDSMMHPTTGSLLFRHFWPYIPESVLRALVRLPAKQFVRMRHALQTINRFSEQLIEQRKSVVKTQRGIDSGDEHGKDLMSILVRANTSENPKYRLTDSEMTAQVATFLLAGHETSAGTLTWLLWELAKDVNYQRKMREEIATARADVIARGDADFTVADLESMEYVNAAIKEIMRLHPIVYLLVRVADKDDVIPLSRPITTATGEKISEIPISKGQHISVSSWGYNRLPEVWGEDAHNWNPSRFFTIDKEKQISVGVFANLLTFGGGNKSCLGWRFTVLEVQAVLVDLIENFEFELPDEKPDIQRVPAGVTIPIIRNNMHLGSQMPLKIIPVNPAPPAAGFTTKTTYIDKVKEFVVAYTSECNRNCTFASKLEASPDSRDLRYKRHAATACGGVTVGWA